MGQTMKRLTLAVLSIAILSSNAMAVSVAELAGKCGEDAKAYCDGVGYGDAMTQCLLAHRDKLKAECKIIVDRVKDGERVSLF